MKKLKQWSFMLLCTILLLGVIPSSPVSIGVKEVQAKASASTKNKAKMAFKKFLQKNNYGYYRLWDINKDGLKELIVTSVYPTGGIGAMQGDVYTYRKGKVQYAGSVGHPSHGILYNTSSGRIHSCRGGGGGIEYWYYTLTKSGKIKQIMCGAYVNGMKNGNTQYKCLYNGKRISFNKFMQITRKWTRQTRTLQFYRNTAYNRKYNLKM